MTLAQAVTSINCTSCGAGLDVLGGGRVTTHICPYCGSALDAQHDYAVLKKYANAERPDSPFRIGMHGHLYGVDWVLIGTLAHRETWAGQVWEWVDHQLFSATHGYAWLTVEDGHLVFTRRYRGAVTPPWISERWVETAENPPVVISRGERFRYLQTSTSKVTFAEGEFTYTPQIGDTTMTISAMSHDHMLDFSQSGHEREIHRGTYVSAAEGLAAFDLPADALRPRGVHALQPLRQGPNAGFVLKTGLAAAAVCLVAGLMLHFQPGRQVLAPATFALADLPQSVTIPIDNTTQLAGVYLESDVSNSWAYVPLDVTDPEDTPLFEAGRSIEYYFGREGNESWTEGSRRASLFFRPTVPGDYEITLYAPETGLWGQQSRAPSRVAVSAYQGLSSGFWMLLLAFGFVLVGAIPLLRRLYHGHRRWKHSDWSEE